MFNKPDNVILLVFCIVLVDDFDHKLFGFGSPLRAQRWLD